MNVTLGIILAILWAADLIAYSVQMWMHKPDLMFFTLLTFPILWDCLRKRKCQ